MVDVVHQKGLIHVGKVVLVGTDGLVEHADQMEIEPFKSAIAIERIAANVQIQIHFLVSVDQINFQRRKLIIGQNQWW